jgi:hypothetical protein
VQHIDHLTVPPLKMISLKNVSVSVSVSFVQSKFSRVSRICTGLPGRAKPDLVIAQSTFRASMLLLLLLLLLLL